MLVLKIFKNYQLIIRQLLILVLLVSAVAARASSHKVSNDPVLYHFGVGATYKEQGAPLFLVEEIKSFGTLGLGALEGDKGEMIVVDGHFYQTDTQGNLSELGNKAKTPIAALTEFDDAQLSERVKASDLEHLEACLLQKMKGSNALYAIRIKGEFQKVVLRSGDKTQPPVAYYKVQGELVGFWAPKHFKEITKPGFHFHFISKGTNKAGHLLDIESMDGSYQLQKIKAIKLQFE